MVRTDRIHHSTHSIDQSRTEGARDPLARGRQGAYMWSSDRLGEYGAGGHTGLAKNTLLDRFRDDDNSAWWRCFTLRPVAPASTGCCSSAPTMRSLSRCPRPICVCAPGRGSRTKERTERPQPVFAQCERNPLCSRGFKHQGHTGTCPSAKTKPRRSSAGAGSGTRPSAKVLRSCGVVGLGPEAQAARAARLQHGRDHRQR
jgi:hypothetical protein